MSAPNIGQKEFIPERISGEIVNKKLTELDENSEISIFNVLELNKYDNVKVTGRLDVIIKAGKYL